VITDDLQFKVDFDDAVLILIAREQDPGVIHVFAPSANGQFVRNMTPEEAKYAEHPLTAEALQDLANEAHDKWVTWEPVDSIVVVHNVMGAAGTLVGEA
jgi:hypothetical protein